MESVKAIQNFILPALEKFQIDPDGPLLSVRFIDTKGNEISVLRGEGNLLAIAQSSNERHGKKDDVEILLYVQGDDWIPTVYGQGKRSLDGASVSKDGTGLEKVKPETMKKIAEKCEAWVNEIVKSNGSRDCLTPTMVQYMEGELFVKKSYALCR